MIRTILTFSLLAMCLVTGGFAQDSKPAIAILSMSHELFPLQISGVLDALEGYGLISAAERATLDKYEDLDGEHVDIVWGSADLSLPNANIVVEGALDQGVDALLTVSTVMSQFALNATQDMEDPPKLFFTSVSDPAGAGLAQDTCLKPAHVTGTQAYQEYEGMFDALLMLAPDLTSVGVLGATGDLASEFGLQRIAEIAAEHGVEVYETAVSDLSQLPVATDGLIGKGIDAIVVPSTIILVPGIGIIVEAAQDAQIPIVTANLSAVIVGSPFGFGAYRLIQEGINTGRMLANWLNGDLDVARTGISVVRGLALGMNLNTASLTQVDVPEELVEMADVVIVGDMYQMSPKMVLDAFQNMPITEDMVIPMVMAANIPGLEVVDGRIQVPIAAVVSGATGFTTEMAAMNAEADAGFIASLHCTDEMIAEQQAELDAAAE